MQLDDPWCTPGLRFYPWMREKDRAARLQTQARLRALRRDHCVEVEIVCSHDVVELERMTGRSAAVPVEAFQPELAPA